MFSQYSVKHTDAHVEVGLGKGTLLLLPVPPVGDDYDYALLGRFYGEGVEPSRFLLSARKLPAPTVVVKPWWQRPSAEYLAVFVAIAILVKMVM